METKGYCLKLQNKIVDKKIQTAKTFECKACEKIFTTKNSYLEHLKICKEIKNQDIKKLKLKITEKENEFEELKNQFDEQNLKIKLESQIKNEIYENVLKNNIVKEIVIKTDIIQNFKLTLEDKSIINIPVRNDGYVNVTELCKASNKNIDNWKKTKESKTLLQFFTVVFYKMGHLILHILSCLKSLVYRYANTIV